MKKVLSIVAIAAMTMFVISCGDGGEAAKADSTRKADSAKKVQDSMDMAAAKQRADDSMKNVAMMAAQKKHDDSVAMADSMAKAKPGKKGK
ncbi:MAG TPA: hypothetical protein VL651_10350 [Bacteroidia bacterium]|jgi:hypothetical protein|nr:hypothetical protein [Bacteroidia bacterium]